jgi:carboxymethylenebutenolidase
MKPDFGAIFDAHVGAEFEQQDLEATMATMAGDPYVWHVPTLMGGEGFEGVRDFYGSSFVGKWPADTKAEEVGRTVGENRVVAELIMSFTHDVQLDVLLPGVPPTGRRVELPVVVVMGFEGEKVAYEHIYWDQGALLAQVGLLDPAEVPVAPDQASRLRQLASRSVS